MNSNRKTTTGVSYSYVKAKTLDLMEVESSTVGKGSGRGSSKELVNRNQNVVVKGD